MKVFYLKVFTNKFFTMQCIQFWLDVCYIHNAHIYIICEKEDLINQMKENLHFGNILLSEYCKKREQTDPVIFDAYFNALRDFSSLIVEHYWINACVSHLSTFYHAKLNNFDSFWNIDADDCIFYLPHKTISEGLKKVEKMSFEKNINCFSFDFWNSHSNGEHWSFGISHIINNTDYFKIIENNTALIHKNWNEICLPNHLKNLNWFFTFIKKNRILNLKTFHFENSTFCHFGFCSNDFQPGSVLQVYEDNKVKYLSNFLDDRVFDRKIYPDNIKIELINNRVQYDSSKKYIDTKCIFDNVKNELKNELKSEYSNFEKLINQLDRQILQIRHRTLFGAFEWIFHKIKKIKINKIRN